ncbi:MAG: two-component sensor histidine kinase [Deltaproteobacteria bacterium]|nr:MAG: two-component sensor histidine kinase [Deltaproteobacteria bacterium]
MSEQGGQHVRGDLGDGIGSFKLVKYFSFSSIGAFLLFTLILSWLISDNARKVMLEQNEEYSLLIAENINQQVYRRFVLPVLVRYGAIALRKPEQFELLDSVVKSVTQGMKIGSVTIYDSSKNIISYSTIPELIGKKDLGKQEYEAALAGNPNSRLTYSGSVLSLLHITKGVECNLKTFIPFKQVRTDGEDDLIMGVIEIDKDLSKNYAHILKFQGWIIIVSSFVMAVLFLVLRLIVSRAGEKIERRALEQQRLEEKLNQTERLAHLGTMVATVSHEIKSPLGIVRSTAEILKKRIRQIAPGNEHLAGIIVDETSRLNTIVVEFLDFARPQSLKCKSVDVNRIICEVVEFLSQELKVNNIDLISDLSPDLPKKEIDAEQFYRALLNICINSLQAMEKGGTLSVHSGLDTEKRLHITVRDSGPGIAAENLKKIFEPFFTQKNRGTGLGLAITKNIVELHGAELSVESVIGEGAAFTIVFPA